MKRTYIYVDGFNLYYGALKNSPYKWLDLKSLFQKLLSKDHNILAIKYFSALVSGRKDPQKPTRQNTYLQALKTFTSEISIYYGHFLSNVVKAPLAHPVGKKKMIEIIKTEEKGSDVNLAIQFLNDAWLDKYDCAVLVSNDSDLAACLNLVRLQHKKLIGVIFPGHSHPSKPLTEQAHFIKHIRKKALSLSQLPTPIPGTNIHKPEAWLTA